MENNNDNPNSNIILNLQKENIELKEKLKEFQEHMRYINLALEKTKEKSYIEGYKQATNDNNVNIKLSPNLGAASGDFTLQTSLKPNTSADLKITPLHEEFKKLLIEELNKAKY